MPIINPTLPNDGETIDASDVNNPFNAILGVLNGGIDSNNIAPGGVSMASLASAIVPFLVPVGSTVAYAGATEPTGWVFCYGQSLLRSSYPALFAAIGTSFGSADGTHFNVPDYRGRSAIGRENMGGTTANRTERSITITTTNASNTITVSSSNGLSEYMYVLAAGVPAGSYITGINGTSVTISQNATATGSGVTARCSIISDPELVGGSGGQDVYTLDQNQIPSHQHRLDRTSGAYGASTASSGYGGNVALNPGASGDTSLYTTATGGGQPHGNLQPSLVTNYIIKT